MLYRKEMRWGRDVIIDERPTLSRQRNIMQRWTGVGRFACTGSRWRDYTNQETTSCKLSWQKMTSSHLLSVGMLTCSMCRSFCWIGEAISFSVQWFKIFAWDSWSCAACSCYNTMIVVNIFLLVSDHRTNCTRDTNYSCRDYAQGKYYTVQSSCNPHAAPKYQTMHELFALFNSQGGGGCCGGVGSHHIVKIICIFIFN